MNFALLNPLRWKKSFLISILVAFSAIWFLFFDTYSLWTRYQLSRKKQHLIEKTAEFNAKAEELEHKIHEIKTNEKLIEKIAREEYGMRKPGEKVYKIKQP